MDNEPETQFEMIDLTGVEMDQDVSEPSPAQIPEEIDPEPEKRFYSALDADLEALQPAPKKAKVSIAQQMLDYFIQHEVTDFNTLTRRPLAEWKHFGSNGRFNALAATYYGIVANLLRQKRGFFAQLIEPPTDFCDFDHSQDKLWRFLTEV